MNHTKITFRGMDTSETITAQVDEWLERLGRHWPIQDAHVTLEAFGGDHPRFNAHVHLHVDGREVVASRDIDPDRAHAKAGTAVRDAMEAVKRQLDDHHARQTSHRRHHDNASQ